MVIRRYIKALFVFVISIGLIIWSLFPIFWMISTSLKNRIDTWAMPPRWIFVPTLENYREVLLSTPFPRYILNSVVVALSSTLIAVGIGTFAAYALARFRFRGSKDIAFWILSIRFLPPVAAAIPFYFIMRNIGWVGHFYSLIVPYLIFNIPFVVWMMRSFIEEVPAEIDEAAMIDGCSRTEAFFKVILPLTAPGLAATMIFCVILSWNEFLFALILTAFESKTVPVAAITYITEKGVLWGQVCAAGTIIIAPIMVFCLIVQKYLVRGLTFGAIK